MPIAKAALAITRIIENLFISFLLYQEIVISGSDLTVRKPTIHETTLASFRAAQVQFCNPPFRLIFRIDVSLQLRAVDSAHVDARPHSVAA
jgi:hypothetical protein